MLDNMDAVKVEQDSCETLLPVSSVCEYQLSENHTVPLIKSESKETVLATGREAESNFTSQQVSSFSEYHVHCKEEETPKTFAFIKTEAEEDSWDLARVKKEMKDEITTEEHEVCEDSVEQVLPKEEDGNFDAGSSGTYGDTCIGETDPLAVSDKDSETSTDVHTKCKPFICEVCGKLFARRGHLEDHSRVHTGDKPFKCDICNKCFQQRGNLMAHIHIHTGNKPFKCGVCSKSFTRRGSLLAHNRIHTGVTPFTCEMCNKSFTRPGSLLVHTRNHTGDKPFKCELCNKSFARRASLVDHRPSHTGEKSFKCEFCNKSFRHRPSLVTHTRTHTGAEPKQGPYFLLYPFQIISFDM